MSFEQNIADIIAEQKSEIALGLSPKTVTSLAQFGIFGPGYHYLSSEQIEQRFSEVRNWMQNIVEGRRLNAVYLDTTTIYAVEMLIRGRDKINSFVTPGTLMDLSTFVESVVLYDTIFHLENQHIDSLALNEALDNEGVIISLPVEKFSQKTYEHGIHSLGEILESIWNDALAYGGEIRKSSPGDPLYEDAQEIKEAWKILFGFDEDINQYFSQEYKSTHWSSPGPELLQQLIGFSHNITDEMWYFHGLDRIHVPEGMSYFISECNLRCLFNLMVGGFLKLYYLPNSYRIPFRNFFYRRARVIQRYLPTIKYIEDEYNNISALYFTPEKDNLALPFFLSALLSQISSLDEFFEALVDIRRKAAAFRRHRTEFDEALSQGDIKVAKKLRSALQKDSKDLRSKFPYIPIAGATAAVLAVLSSAAAPIVLLSIAILSAASLFPPEEVEKLKQRVLSRQFWFLTNMSDAASGLTNAYPKISSLWGLSRSHAYRQELFASHFAKLKALKY